MHALVITNINRNRSAAVFGNVFTTTFNILFIINHNQNIMRDFSFGKGRALSLHLVFPVAGVENGISSYI